MNKRSFTLIAAVLMLAMVTSCASKKDPEPKTLEGITKTLVLEHKGTALGINELPVWVETYVSGGITGLEKLADYKDSYCFVAETTATNLDAGQAWVSGFSIPQDIARNVASRIDALFTGAASGSPEGEYGTYFENIVKAASNTTYSGARKTNDWWVLVRTYDPDVKKKYSDEYRIYILYTIEKDLLDRQVLNVIETIEKTDAGNAEQQKAVSAVKDIMASQGF